MKLQLLVQHMINGLSLGALYALLAVGYTMVYGILKLINFAHGEIFMMGAFFTYFSITLFGFPWWLGMLAGIAGAALLGLLVDQIAYRPLRKAPKISALITAVGVSIFLQSLAIVVFGGVPKSFRGVYPAFFDKIFIIGGEIVEKRGRQVIVNGIRIPAMTIITFAVTGLALLLLWYILFRTRTGMAMRAIAMDSRAVSLMGINGNRIIALTFALGSAMAAVGAILWVGKYPQVWPIMGFMPGLKAFVAAVIGGIGSVSGAVIGGILLGFIEILAVGIMPSLAGYRDVFAFILLILLLSFKPNGIMGKKNLVKV
ncbi:MAG TPA: branched-chain amino acid ABC transporter permease [Thermotogota bacterium]|nr:branched-chain amino acid ABC transporter permease [Thermotogota bacterium]HRW91961.1 branched-chain amino acid ABC transporter permease [Thermotogota bacterium]